MEEAISQLQDLGVTRGQAKKALARYNNDVARAADYIFSGADLSDDDLNETIETDEQLAIRLSREEQNQLFSNTSSSNNPFAETITPPSPTIVNKEPEPVQLDKNSLSNTSYDSSKWSVVPFKEDTTTRNNVTSTSTTNQLANESSLTWWKDPEDPSERMALDDLPIGLRPPSYNFPYSPILIQALYHITFFTEAVLSFRPTPYEYGSPKNYWKGFGDPVPGYIMREVISKRQASTVATPMTFSPTFSPTKNFEETTEQFTDLSLDSSINENTLQSDLPPLIVEREEDTVEFEDHVETELQLMPKCLQALAELQKIFAFLGNTTRLYGSASHFVRALNNKLTSNGWEFSDKTFEGLYQLDEWMNTYKFVVFLDMFIGCLVEADDHSENALESSYVHIFRNMFLLKAKIEYEDDYDEEEVYYLTISLDKNMDSLHNCLDPLVYEAYEEEDKESFKFTTFKKIPPILTIIIENRSSPKKSNFQYFIEKKIYMDRYMIEKKEKALNGFKEMEKCRGKIKKCRQEIERLKSNGENSSQDILNNTLSYFEKQSVNNQSSVSLQDFETLKYILNHVKDSLTSKLDSLESIIHQEKEKMKDIFDSEDMKENGYNLMATFHHDGKSGTGHYWAYIWVEPSTESLLSDIPSEGGWFRFCDAYVTAAKEEDIYNDPTPPFSLMYTSDSSPKFTKEQLFNCISEELKEFIKSDNELLTQEVFEHENPAEAGDVSLISTSEDDAVFVEKPDSVRHADLESSSITFDDNTSVGTAVNGQQVEEFSHIESHHYSFNGPTNSKLKDVVNAKIIQVSNYPSDDYRFLKDFDTFLARAQNQLILEHLYLLYSSEKKLDNENDKELIIDEIAARNDRELSSIWKEYDSYIHIGKTVTKALTYFIKNEYQKSLFYLLETKRKEASWKTEMMLDVDISNSYSGLETLSYDPIIRKFGMMCLKDLNKSMFSIACNASYRTKGLNDAIKLAYHAQTIIGPDNIQSDPVYSSLGELWLSFSEQDGVGCNLTDADASLLNTLILIYLEGQIDRNADIPVRNNNNNNYNNFIPLDESEENEDNIDEIEKLPLWERYKRVRLESEESILMH